MQEVLEQMMIEKLAAVIAVKAENAERQGILNLDESLAYTGFSTAPDRTMLNPARGKIDHSDGENEHAVHRCSAMRDRVGFEKARTGLIPLIGANRDLFAQQRAWTRCGESQLQRSWTVRCEKTIDHGRGDRAKLALRGVGENVPVCVAVAGNPERKNRCQPLPAHEIRCFPDGNQGREDRLTIIRARAPHGSDWGGGGSVQQTDGMLAMDGKHRAKVIEDACSFRFARGCVLCPELTYRPMKTIAAHTVCLLMLVTQL